jgi:hypothetical protein
VQIRACGNAVSPDFVDVIIFTAFQRQRSWDVSITTTTVLSAVRLNRSC